MSWPDVLRGFRNACMYCGAHATTRDHVIPRSQRGRNAWWNLVPACSPCNNARGNSPVLIFLLSINRNDYAAAFQRWDEAIRLLTEEGLKGIKRYEALRRWVERGGSMDHHSLAHSRPRTKLTSAAQARASKVDEPERFKG